MGKLDGKVAVITGAASGIGRSSAVLFADEGAKLILADWQEGGFTAWRGVAAMPYSSDG